MQKNANNKTMADFPFKQHPNRYSGEKPKSTSNVAEIYNPAYKFDAAGSLEKITIETTTKLYNFLTLHTLFTKSSP